MILIENLEVSFSENKIILRDFNLQLADNTIHGIVGLNGAGKTTLLNAIFGLIPIQSGKIFLDNRKISKKDIAYLPAENFFYSNITGLEYLALFKNNNFDITKWNQLFSLPLNSLIESYSTGMRKKLALLSILKQNKPILILDEPFNGLDMESCRILRQVLLGIQKQNKTIIITSHIFETLSNLCNYIHYLEYGAIKSSCDASGFGTLEKEIFSTIESRNELLINELTF